MSQKGLGKLRRSIDRIDSKILKLLNDRAKVVVRVGRIKKTQREEFYTPHREKILLDRLKRKNRGPFPSQALPSVFGEIISASRSLHAPMTVAYLGPEATFTHMAALKHFGRSCRMVPIPSISRVFDEVENRRGEAGVVPIENSTEGVVGGTLDRFHDSSLKITAEITLPIVHNFLTHSGSLRGIERIYSHPQAVGQCRSWLEDRFPNTPIVEVESTSRAAARAAEDRRAGAIASAEAATVYRLKIAQKHIEENPHNMTRFLILGRKSPGPTGGDKTSILFSVKDQVGVLYRMLEPFYRNKINLTKIESRPLKKKVWEYLFFLDMDGHQSEKRIQKGIRELQRYCLFVKVLGSYPKATG